MTYCTRSPTTSSFLPRATFFLLYLDSRNVYVVQQGHVNRSNCLNCKIKPKRRVDRIAVHLLIAVNLSSSPDKHQGLPRTGATLSSAGTEIVGVSPGGTGMKYPSIGAKTSGRSNWTGIVVDQPTGTMMISSSMASPHRYTKIKRRRRRRS